jgi:hypothetical protein
LSAAAKLRGFGGVRQSKKILYNGIKLGSTYEVITAMSLDQHNILWTKPNRIPYIDPTGKQRTYEADFYLPDYNIYLGPKNDFLINSINPRLGFKDTEKISLVLQQNNVRILILSKENLRWEEIVQLIGSDSN